MADETILSKPDDAKALVEKHFPEPVATTAVTHTELREFLVEFLEKILGEEPGKSEPERAPPPLDPEYERDDDPEPAPAPASVRRERRPG